MTEEGNRLLGLYAIASKVHPTWGHPKDWIGVDPIEVAYKELRRRRDETLPDD